MKSKAPNLEEILARKGLLEKETIMKNVLENKKFVQASKVVLVSLLAVGVITTAVAAPGVIMALQPFLRRDKYKREDLHRAKRTIAALKHRRFIEVEIGPEGQVLKLTEKGKEKALKCYLKALVLKYKKWDGKWRIFIFDIPTKLNRKRDILREFLDNMGFRILQKSIYISPYPCREEIEAIVEYLQLKSYIKFFEADFVDDHEILKKRFGISN